MTDKKRRNGPKPNQVQILPPIPAEAGLVLPANPHRPEPLLLTGELPPELAFEPIITQSGRQKFVPLLQGKFIQALSITGSVTTSAAAVGMSIGQVYGVKNGPRAESFGEAWEKAIRMGAIRARDNIVDHAVNGTPEYFYKDGELVGERRHFNLRAMMWVVTHVMPHIGEGAGGLAGAGVLPQSLVKLKEQWRKEWEEEMSAEAQTKEADEAARKEAELQTTLDRLTRKYQAKIREEYYHRAAGNAIAADFALRQMTQLEVIMDVGGLSYNFIKNAFHKAPHGGPWSTKTSRALEDARHEAWEKESAQIERERVRDLEEGYGAEGGEERPPHPIYQRPRTPYYQTEADRAADLAARAALTAKAVGWRESQAAEQEWRDGRRVESDRPDEGETFLPGS